MSRAGPPIVVLRPDLVLHKVIVPDIIMGKRKSTSANLTVKRSKTSLSNNGSILTYLNSVETALNDEILTVEEELGRIEATVGASGCSSSINICPLKDSKQDTERVENHPPINCPKDKTYSQTLGTNSTSSSIPHKVSEPSNLVDIEAMVHQPPQVPPILLNDPRPDYSISLKDADVRTNVTPKSIKRKNSQRKNNAKEKGGEAMVSMAHLARVEKMLQEGLTNCFNRLSVIETRVDRILSKIESLHCIPGIISQHTAQHPTSPTRTGLESTSATQPHISSQISIPVSSNPPGTTNSDLNHPERVDYPVCPLINVQAPLLDRILHSQPNADSNVTPVNNLHAPISSSVLLDLPPQAAPYVVILCNVPQLAEPVVENFPQLKNKVIHWLAKQPDPVSLNRLANSIIMARRIGWIGKSPRQFAGDCIIVNFNDPSLVQHFLTTRGPSRDLYAGVTLQPLSFFYHKAFPPPFFP